MSYNLFIAYDLDKPLQNYEAVQSQIKKLGRWYHQQYSLFYVQSDLDMKAAHDFVRLVMDRGDKLIVIEAKDAFASFLPYGDLAAIQNVFADGAQYIPA